MSFFLVFFLRIIGLEVSGTASRRTGERFQVRVTSEKSFKSIKKKKKYLFEELGKDDKTSYLDTIVLYLYIVR